MKAFAVNTIQRGASADPRVVLAGSVFDASDEELLHLTPIGAVRKPTKEELAIDRWVQAEAEDAARNDAAALVASVFGDEPTQGIADDSGSPAAPKIGKAPSKSKAKAESKAEAKVEGEDDAKKEDDDALGL